MSIWFVTRNDKLSKKSEARVSARIRRGKSGCHDTNLFRESPDPQRDCEVDDGPEMEITTEGDEGCGKRR